MRSRLLLNLVLALAALALGVYLFWVPAPPAVLPPYPAMDSTQIATLRIATATGAPIELVRVDDGWRMVQPFDTAADSVAVQRLLSRSPPRVYRRYELAAVDLGALGLEPPQLSLSLDQATLAFGARAPLEGYRYMLADDAVFLADQALPQLLSMGVGALVDKHPITTGRSIDRLELPTLVLTRTEIGWSRDPEDGAASDADQRLADLWTASQAINIQSQPQALPPDLVRIGIGTDDGMFRELWLDPSDTGLHLYDLDGGLVYEMPGGSRSGMLGLDREPEPPETD